MSKKPSNPNVNTKPKSSGALRESETSTRESHKNGYGGKMIEEDGTVKINRFTPLVFTGTARQLFGIQFVNILLSLITLGIWIPWARVRNRRFFYGNTRALDEGIDYLATGFALFKGWVLVLAAITIFYVTPLFADGVPYVQEGLSALFVLVYPWALTKSIYFNARNLAWRDVSFDWKGGYFGAAWYFFLFPVIAVLSFGLLLPVMSCKARQYIVNNYRFGKTSFEADLDIGSFYKVAVQALLAFIFMLILVGVFSFCILVMIFGYQTGDTLFDNLMLFTAYDLGNMSSYLLYLIPLLFLATFYATGAFYHALTRNIMINKLKLHGGIKFRSELSGTKLAWIIISNNLVTLLSLGLLWPWAQVRRYRYMVESTQLRPSQSIDNFIDTQSRAGHSIGDAASDAGGIELQF
ncbi:YjgN family protein [uncultured Candidatus Puniceispirillum sp.]|uniref:YjgN family protein n=1 Tax=uncultured Candidatus Puniceispirillum sp. TaxID=1985115 RepID=UPI0032B2F85F